MVYRFSCCRKFSSVLDTQWWGCWVVLWARMGRCSAALSLCELLPCGILVSTWYHQLFYFVLSFSILAILSKCVAILIVNHGCLWNLWELEVGRMELDLNTEPGKSSWEGDWETARFMRAWHVCHTHSVVPKWRAQDLAPTVGISLCVYWVIEQMIQRLGKPL